MTYAPFEVTWNGYVPVIITAGYVSCAYTPEYDSCPHPPFIPVQLLWDTGAEVSMISKSLADKLNLQPISIDRCVNTHGIVEVYRYRINLRLPNNVEISEVDVICDDLPDTDILIGMNVINLCDISYTHHPGLSRFSFQMSKTD